MMAVKILAMCPYPSSGKRSVIWLTPLVLVRFAYAIAWISHSFWSGSVLSQTRMSHGLNPSFIVHLALKLIKKLVYTCCHEQQYRFAIQQAERSARGLRALSKAKGRLRSRQARLWSMPSRRKRGRMPVCIGNYSVIFSPQYFN